MCKRVFGHAAHWELSCYIKRIRFSYAFQSQYIGTVCSL